MNVFGSSLIVVIHYSAIVQEEFASLLRTDTVLDHWADWIEAMLSRCLGQVCVQPKDSAVAVFNLYAQFDQQINAVVFLKLDRTWCQTSNSRSAPPSGGH